MEPIAPELLMALASGTAGAAGQQIWTSLRDLVRRRTDAEPGGEGELTALAAAVGSVERVARAERLAQVLAEWARQDSAFADALRAWRQDAVDAMRTGPGDVHNEVSGGRQETVILARDIHGDINLGGHGG
ncbi:hypothetical protein [Streptomyces sp. XD-27]|uniref:hypothetical protein n=1 Tax=Streptomyces sp. XD-27 TaxID=3062779 RepID=UPI0026F45EA1|nr:hypothetical protein [Streptomyces sp. XD-27]WKX72179.1 hypothetical protein Q3Y56_21760 [Streptomyces sp. XD-27]